MRPQHITAENTQHALRIVGGPGGASMRPQHITAENFRMQARAAHVGPLRASMRPQHITAENSGWRARWAGERRRFNEAAAYHCGKRGRPSASRTSLACRASMRPQHITAENFTAPIPIVRRLSASMRPQHITAENPTRPTSGTPAPPCFNEAAAYHCGKRRRVGRLAAEWPWASMRPQHITAENPPGASARRRRAPSFNEAAAYHCGKRDRVPARPGA